MLEKYISSLLVPYLERYAENVDPKQLSISIWSGSASLKDLVLKPSIIDDLNLPVQLHRGVCKNITFDIPVKSLNSKPLVVNIGDVFMTLRSTVEKPANRSAERARDAQEKQKALESFEEDRKKKAADSKVDASDTGVVARLAERVGHNVLVNVKSVHIRLEDVESNTVIGFVLGNVRLITVNKDGLPEFVDPSTTKKLRKLFEFSDLTVYCEDAASLQKRSLGSNRTMFTCCEPNLELWEHKMISRIGMCPDTIVFGPAAGSVTASLVLRQHLKELLTSPFLEANAKLTNIVASLSREQYSGILSLVSKFQSWKALQPVMALRSSLALCFHLSSARRRWLLAVGSVRRILRRSRCKALLQALSKQLVPLYAQLYEDVVLRKVSSSTAKVSVFQPRMATAERDIGLTAAETHDWNSNQQKRLDTMTAGERTEWRRKLLVDACHEVMTAIDIIDGRKRAYNSIAAQVKSAKQIPVPEKKSGFFSGFGKKSTDTKPSDSPSWEEIAKEYGIANCEADDDFATVKASLCPDYCWMRLSVSLPTCGTTIRLGDETVDNKRKLRCSCLLFTDIKANLNVFNKSNSFDFQFSTKDVAVTHPFYDPSGRPDDVTQHIVSRLNDGGDTANSSPVFEVSGAVNPPCQRIAGVTLDGDFSVRLLPMRIVCDPEVLVRFIEFGKVPPELDVSGISRTAKALAAKAHSAASTGLSDAIANSKAVFLDFDAAAPIVIVPATQRSSTGTSLCVSMGRCIFKSVPISDAEKARRVANVGLLGGDCNELYYKSTAQFSNLFVAVSTTNDSIHNPRSGFLLLSEVHLEAEVLQRIAPTATSMNALIVKATSPQICVASSVHQMFLISALVDCWVEHFDGLKDSEASTTFQQQGTAQPNTTQQSTEHEQQESDQRAANKVSTPDARAVADEPLFSLGLRVEKLCVGLHADDDISSTKAWCTLVGEPLVFAVQTTTQTTHAVVSMSDIRSLTSRGEVVLDGGCKLTTEFFSRRNSAKQIDVAVAPVINVHLGTPLMEIVEVVMDMVHLFQSENKQTPTFNPGVDDGILWTRVNISVEGIIATAYSRDATAVLQHRSIANDFVLATANASNVEVHIDLYTAVMNITGNVGNVQLFVANSAPFNFLALNKNEPLLSKDEAICPTNCDGDQNSLISFRYFTTTTPGPRFGKSPDPSKGDPREVLNKDEVGFTRHCLVQVGAMRGTFDMHTVMTLLTYFTTGYFVRITLVADRPRYDGKMIPKPPPASQDILLKLDIKLRGVRLNIPLHPTERNSHVLAAVIGELQIENTIDPETVTNTLRISLIGLKVVKPSVALQVQEQLLLPATNLHVRLKNSFDVTAAQEKLLEISCDSLCLSTDSDELVDVLDLVVSNVLRMPTDKETATQTYDRSLYLPSLIASDSVRSFRQQQSMVSDAFDAIDVTVSSSFDAKVPAAPVGVVVRVKLENVCLTLRNRTVPHFVVEVSNLAVQLLPQRTQKDISWERATLCDVRGGVTQGLFVVDSSSICVYSDTSVMEEELCVELRFRVHRLALSDQWLDVYDFVVNEAVMKSLSPLLEPVNSISTSTLSRSMKLSIRAPEFVIPFLSCDRRVIFSAFVGGIEVDIASMGNGFAETQQQIPSAASTTIAVRIFSASLCHTATGAKIMSSSADCDSQDGKAILELRIEAMHAETVIAMVLTGGNAIVAMPIVQQLIFYCSDPTQPLSKIAKLGVMKGERERIERLATQVAEGGVVRFALEWHSPTISLLGDGNNVPCLQHMMTMSVGTLATKVVYNKKDQRVEVVATLVKVEIEGLLAQSDLQLTYEMTPTEENVQLHIEKAVVNLTADNMEDVLWVLNRNILAPISPDESLATDGLSQPTIQQPADLNSPIISTRRRSVLFDNNKGVDVVLWRDRGEKPCASFRFAALKAQLRDNALSCDLVGLTLIQLPSLQPMFVCGSSADTSVSMHITQRGDILIDVAHTHTTLHPVGVGDIVSTLMSITPPPALEPTLSDIKLPRKNTLMSGKKIEVPMCNRKIIAVSVKSSTVSLVAKGRPICCLTLDGALVKLTTYPQSDQYSLEVWLSSFHGSFFAAGSTAPQVFVAPKPPHVSTGSTPRKLTTLDWEKCCRCLIFADEGTLSFSHWNQEDWLLFQRCLGVTKGEIGLSPVSLVVSLRDAVTLNSFALLSMFAAPTSPNGKQGTSISARVSSIAITISPLLFQGVVDALKLLASAITTKHSPGKPAPVTKTEGQVQGEVPFGVGLDIIVERPSIKIISDVASETRLELFPGKFTITSTCEGSVHESYKLFVDEMAAEVNGQQAFGNIKPLQVVFWHILDSKTANSLSVAIPQLKVNVNQGQLDSIFDLAGEFLNLSSLPIGADADPIAPTSTDDDDIIPPSEKKFSSPFSVDVDLGSFEIRIASMFQLDFRGLCFKHRVSWHRRESSLALERLLLCHAKMSGEVTCQIFDAADARFVVAEAVDPSSGDEETNLDGGLEHITIVLSPEIVRDSMKALYEPFFVRVLRTSFTPKVVLDFEAEPRVVISQDVILNEKRLLVVRNSRLRTFELDLGRRKLVLGATAPTPLIFLADGCELLIRNGSVVITGAYSLSSFVQFGLHSALRCGDDCKVSKRFFNFERRARVASTPIVLEENFDDLALEQNHTPKRTVRSGVSTNKLPKHVDSLALVVLSPRHQSTPSDPMPSGRVTSFIAKLRVCVCFHLVSDDCSFDFGVATMADVFYSLQSIGDSRSEAKRMLSAKLTSLRTVDDRLLRPTNVELCVVGIDSISATARCTALELMLRTPWIQSLHTVVLGILTGVSPLSTDHFNGKPSPIEYEDENNIALREVKRVGCCRLCRERTAVLAHETTAAGFLCWKCCTGNKSLVAAGVDVEVPLIDIVLCTRRDDMIELRGDLVFSLTNSTAAEIKGRLQLWNYNRAMATWEPWIEHFYGRLDANILDRTCRVLVDRLEYVFSLNTLSLLTDVIEDVSRVDARSSQDKLVRSVTVTNFTSVDITVDSVCVAAYSTAVSEVSREDRSLVIACVALEGTPISGSVFVDRSMHCLLGTDIVCDVRPLEASDDVTVTILPLHATQRKFIAVKNLLPIPIRPMGMSIIQPGQECYVQSGYCLQNSFLIEPLNAETGEVLGTTETAAQFSVPTVHDVLNGKSFRLSCSSPGSKIYLKISATYEVAFCGIAKFNIVVEPSIVVVNSLPCVAVITLYEQIESRARPAEQIIVDAHGQAKSLMYLSASSLRCELSVVVNDVSYSSQIGSVRSKTLKLVASSGSSMTVQLDCNDDVLKISSPYAIVNHTMFDLDVVDFVTSRTIAANVLGRRDKNYYHLPRNMSVPVPAFPDDDKTFFVTIRCQEYVAPELPLHIPGVVSFMNLVSPSSPQVMNLVFFTWVDDSGTRLVEIAPRWILVNRLEKPLFAAEQIGSNVVLAPICIPPKSAVPLVFTAKKETLGTEEGCKFRFSQTQSVEPGVALYVEEISNTNVVARGNADEGQLDIMIDVSVTTEDPYTFVIIEEPTVPPYVVNNRCAIPLSICSPSTERVLCEVSPFSMSSFAFELQAPSFVPSATDSQPNALHRIKQRQRAVDVHIGGCIMTIPLRRHNTIHRAEQADDHRLDCKNELLDVTTVVTIGSRGQLIIDVLPSVRLHDWKFVPALPTSLEMVLNIKSLTFSLCHRQQEITFGVLEDFRLLLKRTDDREFFQASLTSFQFDNQIEEQSKYETCVFAIRSNPDHSAVAVYVERTIVNAASVVHIDEIRADFAPVAVRMTDAMLLAVFRLYQDARRSNNDLDARSSLGWKCPDMAALYSRSPQAAGAMSAQIDIDRIVVNPIQFRLWFFRNGDEDLFAGQFDAGRAALMSLMVTSCEDVSVTAPGITASNENRRAQLQIHRFSDFYVSGIKKQVQGLLLQYASSLPLIGAPIRLVSDVGNGAVMFFREPIEGLVNSPKAFAMGLARGSVGLVGNIIGGGFNAVGNVAGTTARLASLASGTSSRDHQSANTLTGLVSGLTGCVTKPIQGAAEGGVAGMMKGFGQGLLGIVANPVSGILSDVSRVANVTASVFNDKFIPEVRRLRTIRQFSAAGGIAAFGSIVQVVEYQRRDYEKQSWTTNLLPTDGPIWAPKTKEQMQAELRFPTEKWQYETFEATLDGWKYARTYYSANFSSVVDKKTHVRRRRWVAVVKERAHSSVVPQFVALHTHQTVVASSLSVSQPRAASIAQPLQQQLDLRVVETFENERKYPFVGWTKKMLVSDRSSWSSRDGKMKLTKDCFVLPSGWEWAGEWAVCFSGDVDADGWEYALDFPRKFTKKETPVDCVRRRCWRRTMKRSKDNK